MRRTLPNPLRLTGLAGNPRVALFIVLMAAGCASQAPSLSPFYGKVLRAAGGPGASLLAVETGRDPAVADWLEANGAPAYLIVSSDRLLRLLYVEDDRVVAFTRNGEPGDLKTGVDTELGVPEMYSRYFSDADRARLAVLHAPPPEDEIETTVLLPEPEPKKPPEPKDRRIEYTVETVEDISVLKATRFRYKVRVPRILSEKEIRSLSSDIIEQAPPHNGMDIYFYLPDSTLETGFTAGKAEWWPNGVAGDADKVAAGDYSSHELVVTAGNSWGVPIPELKQSAEIPKEMRRAIYFELVVLEDRGVPHSDAARRLAEHHGVAKPAIDEIAREGMARGWPMPPEPE